MRWKSRREFLLVTAGSTFFFGGCSTLDDVAKVAVRHASVDAAEEAISGSGEYELVINDSGSMRIGESEYAVERFDASKNSVLKVDVEGMSFPPTVFTDENFNRFQREYDPDEGYEYPENVGWSPSEQGPSYNLPENSRYAMVFINRALGVDQTPEPISVEYEYWLFSPS